MTQVGGGAGGVNGDGDAAALRGWGHDYSEVRVQHDKYLLQVSCAAGGDGMICREKGGTYSR